MDNVSLFLAFGVITTRLADVIGGLLVSYLATRQKIDALRNTSWYRPELSPSDNHERSKEEFSAEQGYLVFLKTSAILMLAKAIEDTLHELEWHMSKKSTSGESLRREPTVAWSLKCDAWLTYLSTTAA